MIKQLSLLACFTLTLVLGCAPKAKLADPISEDQVLANPTQLTRSFQRAGEAYFSPDMQWIIFQAAKSPEEDYQMYVAQLKWENGKPTGLNTPIGISPSPSWNTCGYFSPDGNSIIFASTANKHQPLEGKGGYQRGQGSYRWSMPPEAEIYRADGWRGAISALGPGGKTDLAKHALTNNNAYDAECAFSPDGQWIVFARKVGDEPAPATTKPIPNLDLFAMRSDGTREVRLTNVPGYDGGPFFSPDGKRLLYRSDRKGNNLLQVFVADLVFDAAGNITGIANEKQLTDDVNVNWGPCWHPSGKTIIWATSIHGHSNYELYMMNDSGKRKVRVTFTQNADVLPVFSPDGKWLMWTSSRGADKTSQIWIAEFKGDPWR
jgi:Tol biopolymer transport system component